MHRIVEMGKGSSIESSSIVQPWYSKRPMYDPAASQVFCCISVICILGTVLVIILESMPEFQRDVCENYAENITLTSNLTNRSCTVWVRRSVKELQVTDTIFMFWFTMEYLARLWSAPDRWQNFKNPLSLIDLVTLLPFYVELIDKAFRGGHQNGAVYSMKKSMQSGRTLRILKVFRALRVLKLARYSSDIRLLGEALNQSKSEFLMILVYMLLATFVYSTVMYHVEGDIENSKYATIPKAAWWTIATTFTYGDAPPDTVLGRFISSTGFVAGILLLAFPITVLVDKFNNIYATKTNAKKPPSENNMYQPPKNKSPSGGMRRNTVASLPLSSSKAPRQLSVQSIIREKQRNHHEPHLGTGQPAIWKSSDTSQEVCVIQL